MPAPKTDARGARVNLGNVDRGAEAGRESAGKQTGPVEGSLRIDLGQSDLRHHRRLGKGRRSHEVPNLIPVSSQPRSSVGEVALVLLLADRQAEVGPFIATVDAFATLGREEGHDVVSDRERFDSGTHFLDHASPFVAQHGWGIAGGIDSRCRCRDRCGRRHMRLGGRGPHLRSARSARAPERPAAHRTPRAPRRGSSRSDLGLAQ